MPTTSATSAAAPVASGPSSDSAPSQPACVMGPTLGARPAPGAGRAAPVGTTRPRAGLWRARCQPSTASASVIHCSSTADTSASSAALSVPRAVSPT